VITRHVSHSVQNDTGKPAGTTDDWPSKGYAVYADAKAPPDRDHDGMPDDWETRFKLNPDDASDSAADSDHDGYTNIEEFINGTDPTQFIDYHDPANNFDARPTTHRVTPD
jgi:hypothetical protein